MGKHVLSLSVAALAAILPNPAAAETRYAFTRIADDTASAAEIGVAPAALNDAGQVAFMAGGPPGAAGVFMGSGGPLTTVADTTGAFRALGFPTSRIPLSHGFASIDGLGQATFAAVTQDSRNGYFAGPGGAVIVADTTPPILGFDGDVFSSGSGSATTFEALEFVNQRLTRAILVGKGGPPTSIADTSLTFSALDLDPRVNASGLVAFHGTRRDGSEGIFVGSGGPLTTIADTSGPFAAFTDAPAIADTGEVLFQATLKASANHPRIQGLFRSRGGTIQTVVDDRGAFASFGFAPAVNARGQVAFEGTTKSGLVGIFTGRDPEEDCVIAVGDPLDGSTVFDLSISSFRTSLNDQGQIAFIAQLENGRTGVYRADPSRRHDRDGHCRHQPHGDDDGDERGDR
jgi:hypothetical protein